MSRSNIDSMNVGMNCRSVDNVTIRQLNEEVERIITESLEERRDERPDVDIEQSNCENIFQPINHLAVIRYRERVVEIGARFQVFPMIFNELTENVRTMRSHVFLWHPNQVINDTLRSHTRMSSRFFERLEFITNIIGMKYMRNDLELIIVNNSLNLSQSLIFLYHLGYIIYAYNFFERMQYIHNILQSGVE